jgi:hypothetical protein
MITHHEVTYRLWWFVVCDLENHKNEEAMTRVGSQRHNKKRNFILANVYIYIYTYLLHEAESFLRS